MKTKSFLTQIKEKKCKGKFSEHHYQTLVLQSISNLQNQKVVYYAFAGSIVAAYFGAYAGVVITYLGTDKVIPVTVFGTLGAAGVLYVAIHFIHKKFSEIDKEINEALIELETVPKEPTS